ncbi:MAG: hypothetical protein WBQ64_12270 [Terriglobales bacterium]
MLPLTGVITTVRLLFASALAGIAIDRGALSGASETVLPEMSYSSYANPDPRKAAITLGDLLANAASIHGALSTCSLISLLLAQGKLKPIPTLQDPDGGRHPAWIEPPIPFGPGATVYLAIWSLVAP